MADKAALLKQKFKEQDKNGDGKLDFDEMKSLLQQGNPNIKDAQLMKLFNKVDSTGDGFIEFNEFVDYLYSGSRTSEGRNMKMAMKEQGLGEDAPWDDVVAVYGIYDKEGNGLDGKEFIQMLKDSKVITRKFTTTDADLIFAKVCPKGQRKIGVEEFKSACRNVATKKGISTAEVQSVIGARVSEGKILTGTKADAVRFHDDKTTYTGAHTHNAAHGDHLGGESTDDRRNKRAADGDAKLQALGEEADWGECAQVFKEYGGADGVDSKEFSKLLEDCGVLDKKFQRNDADVVFASVAKGQRKLQLEQFKAALKQIGVRKGEAIADVQAQVGARAGQGQANKGTKADDVRFYKETKGGDATTTASRHDRLTQQQNADMEGIGEEGEWDLVEQVFHEYDKDENGFDNKEFVKLLKDTNILVGKKFQSTDADIIFAKVCPKGKRKLAFEEFREALKLIAVKKDCGIADLQNLVAQRAGLGQAMKGTKADNVRFHDDKTTYTGSHADGAAVGRHDEIAKKAAAEAADVGEEADWGDSERAFKAYDTQGDGFDNREFNYMMKECGLFDPKFTSADVDIIFMKVVPKGKRKIGWGEFQEALRQVAAKKKCKIAEVQAKVGARADLGKELKGTQADAVRFHDDKTSYTGAHAHNETHGDHLGEQGDRAEARHAKEAEKKAALGEELDWGDVSTAYHAYDPQGNGLDSKEFQKMLWDADLIDKKFTTQQADVTFAKFKARKLMLEDFKEALRDIAVAKGCPIADVQAAVGAHTDGAVLHGTQADSVRFHDDKDTYTGMHHGK